MLAEIESVEGLKEMVRQNIGVTLTLPALIRPSQIGNDLVLLPITNVPEEFIFIDGQVDNGTETHYASAIFL